MTDVIICALCAQMIWQYEVPGNMRYLAMSLARSPLLLVVFGPEVEGGAFWGADWG